MAIRKAHYDRRSQHQFEFDMAVKGWAFCNEQMLRSRIAGGESILLKLAASDPRHETMKAMKEMLNDLVTKL